MTGETWTQMKRRHREEQIELAQAAVKAEGTQAAAARRLMMSENAFRQFWWRYVRPPREGKE